MKMAHERKGKEKAVFQCTIIWDVEKSTRRSNAEAQGPLAQKADLLMQKDRLVGLEKLNAFFQSKIIQDRKEHTQGKS